MAGAQLDNGLQDVFDVERVLLTASDSCRQSPEISGKSIQQMRSAACSYDIPTMSSQESKDMCAVGHVMPC